MDAALVILDGWALGSHGDRDAVRAAYTPTMDRYRAVGASGTLVTHGRAVGLPNGQMGNSEVGHLNVGAGRVVKQAFTRISDDIREGGFVENEALRGAIDDARDHDGRVHLLGLVSDGGVHSSQAHLHALIELAADAGVEAVTHAFTDGRDTDPTGGERYLQRLREVVDRAGTGDVATVSGRYYAMDRDENWERTRRAYDAIVNREADHEAADAVAAVRASYDRGETDEFVEPTLVEGGPALADGDAAIWFNFRADRARQLVRMLGDVDPDWEFETTPPAVELATMTEYDREFDVPVAYPPEQPTDTVGEVVSAAGMTQLRLAESEKYPHVTYFLNGGREVEFDGERRTIVDSPDVPTYDERPAMSAAAVTDAALDAVDDWDPDVLVCNYANADMVGHTGDYGAAIEAVEAVDAELRRLVDGVRDAGGHVLVTADHGNADDMGRPGDPHTAHTFAPVPVIYLAPDRHAPGDDVGGYAIRDGGTLSDLAPTLLDLLGIDRPAAMTGETLLETESEPDADAEAGAGGD
jgi:2,3-bisphosphoglycerate-independent phosphoglycerate mutase